MRDTVCSLIKTVFASNSNRIRWYFRNLILHGHKPIEANSFIFVGEIVSTMLPRVEEKEEEDNRDVKRQ